MRTILILCLAIATLTAQDFKLYPGAKPDATSKQGRSEVYTTPDSFEKVCAFYRSNYKEYHWPAPAPKLPSGKEVQWAFFILDGSKDLMHSKYFVKIQRPYILTVGEGDMDFKGIRDVSAIQTVHRN